MSEPQSEIVDEEEAVSRLLEGAGARPEPPAEDLARIKEAFRAEWRGHVRRRPRRAARWNPRLLALAATVAAAAVAGWWLWSFAVTGTSGASGGGDAGPAARIESLAGEANGLAPGGTVPAGATVETAAGVAALRLAGGGSLRLDEGTRVVLVSPSEVRLDRGAVYLDSGAAPGAGSGPVEIRTRLGVVTEVGTQFEVRLLEEGEAVRVRVREGEVRIEGGAASASAMAGAELTVRAGGSVARGSIPVHGPAWSWTLKAAPPLEIEGRTLDQLLARVARETGWTVEYENEALAASAGSIRLHGDVGHLAPDQILDIVLPGAGLRHRVADGRLIVGADAGFRTPN